MLQTSGKRKSAIARAVLKSGTGKVTFNRIPIELVEPRLARLKLKEPLILAGDAMKKVDIAVTVKGGGFIGQSDAARVAIGKALVQQFPDLKEVLLNYDRQL